MGPLVVLVVAGLACYRATRLITTDTFPPVARPRGWLELHAPSWVGTLVTCHWCASGWVSLTVVAGVDVLSGVSVPAPPVMWLAVWAVGAGLAHLEPEK